MSLAAATQAGVKALFNALKDAQIEMELKSSRRKVTDGINVTSLIATEKVNVILDDIDELSLDESLVGVVSKVAYLEIPKDVQVGDTFHDRATGETYTVRKFVPITLGRTVMTQEVMLE